MLEESFERLYLVFRANYYKRMVERIGPREGSLSATDNFCVEIIYLLQRPTVSTFAQFLGISVPNANYKINSLEKKGYVRRVPSQRDRREFHLEVTDKYLDYYGLKDADNAHLMQRIRQTFTPQEVAQLDVTIQKILALMEPQEETDG